MISGYSKQCPRCEVMIFFEDGAMDKNVARALLDAKQLRRALSAESDEKIKAKSEPYNFGR